MLVKFLMEVPGHEHFLFTNNGAVGHRKVILRKNYGQGYSI